LEYGYNLVGAAKMKIAEKKNIKILFVAHSFANGGAEKCLFDLVAHCYEKGFACIVIGPEKGPYIKKLNTLGASVKRIKFGSIFISTKRYGRSKRMVKLIFNTYRVIKEIILISPDVVYSNTSGVLPGALAARITGVPHIWHIHENLITFKIKFIIPISLIKILIKRLSDRVIFVSYLALKSFFPDNLPNNAMVIHNGVRIDPSIFRRIKSKENNCIDYKEATLNIGFIGSVEHRKGLDILILALAEIYCKCPVVNLEVWGAGEYSYLKYLKKICLDLSISEIIRFMGYAQNVELILPRYDVVVIPSRAESFSLVAIEAMAAGIPVIATRCGGPEEIIEDGVNGYLVSPNDFKGIEEALWKIYKNKSKAEEIAKKGQETVINEYNLEAKLDSIVEVIQKVVRR
jgi:glycosyltransferase involved in cell wall biosynthesis